MHPRTIRNWWKDIKISQKFIVLLNYIKNAYNSRQYPLLNETVSINIQLHFNKFFTSHFLWVPKCSRALSAQMPECLRYPSGRLSFECSPSSQVPYECPNACPLNDQVLDCSPWALQWLKGTSNWHWNWKWTKSMSLICFSSK